MKKARKSFSLTMILAIMLLACLLMCSLGATGAWFSATGGKINFTLNVSGADIYVYQGNVKLDSTKQQYITLEQEIQPDVEVPLVLTLKSNEPSGNYVRFKFQVFAIGQTNTEITVDKNISSPTSSTNGFTRIDEENENDFYYYANSSTELQKFTDDQKIGLVLISGFTIKSDDFAQLNGDTIKIVLTVECSDVNWNTQSN